MAMFSERFIYDGVSCELHDIAICRFNDLENKITAGGTIKVETFKPNIGYKWNAISAQYDEPLTISFQFFHVKGNPFDNIERRTIAKWLLRNDHTYRWLQFDDTSEACFRVICTQLDWITYNDYNGAEVKFIADSPWAYTNELKKIVQGNTTLIINNYSDSYDHIYPAMTIAVLQAGDIKITNTIENRETIIRNCNSGEVITINPETKSIVSSVSNHLLYNDFNYIFLRLSQTARIASNPITVSGNAVVTLTWREARRCLL